MGCVVRWEEFVLSCFDEAFVGVPLEVGFGLWVHLIQRRSTVNVEVITGVACYERSLN